MTPVFLDTVGLIALWDKDDQWHDAAERAYQSIANARRTAVTTTFVLLECGNTAARRTFRKDVCDLRDALELRDELIAPTNEEWLQAWAAYQRGEAGDAGIVDHVSFLVMKRALRSRKPSRTTNISRPQALRCSSDARQRRLSVSLRPLQYATASTSLTGSG